MKELIIFTTILMGGATAIVMPIAYSYQMYYHQDKRTATNGIFFHDTIELKYYNKLGTATSLFCPNGADIFTRSVNHESFTVCKKKGAYNFDKSEGNNPL